MNNKVIANAVIMCSIIAALISVIKAHPKL